MPTDMQVKEFWERYGFKWNDRMGMWHDPIHGLISSILPLINLINLFEYAVTQLIKEGWEITISFDQDFKTWDVELCHPAKFAVLKQMACLKDALFWALDQVRKQESE